MQMTKIEKVGRLGTIELPEGWEGSEVPPSPWVIEFLWIANPIGDKDVILAVHVRRALPETGAEKFLHLLKEPDQDILLDNVQRYSVIIHRMPFDIEFEQETMRTCELSGRTVLELRRFWKTQGKQAIEFIADMNGDGRIPLRLMYAASPGNFERFEEEAMSILRSLKW